MTARTGPDTHGFGAQERSKTVPGPSQKRTPFCVWWHRMWTMSTCEGSRAPTARCRREPSPRPHTRARTLPAPALLPTVAVLHEDVPLLGNRTAASRAVPQRPCPARYCFGPPQVLRAGGQHSARVGSVLVHGHRQRDRHHPAGHPAQVLELKKRAK